MSTQENMLIVRRIHEELNNGNIGVIDELYAADYLSHVAARTGDREQLREYVKNLRAAFPNWRSTIEDIMAVDDKVVVRVTERGTHKADWLHHHVGRLAPTGREVTTTRIIVRRIAKGKIVEAWVNADHLGLLRQLGAIPASVDAKASG